MRNVTQKIGKNGEISYLIRVSCGYDVNGKQIKKSMIYKPTSGMTQKQIDKELKRRLVMFEDKVKNGYATDDNIKFADYAERWLSINPEISVLEKEKGERAEKAGKIKGKKKR